jgi:hypothetical protein
MSNIFFYTDIYVFAKEQNFYFDCQAWQTSGIGIGGTVAHPPLPHHRTCGSAYGGSEGYVRPSYSCGKTKRVEVRCGQREMQSRTVSHAPRTAHAACCLSSKCPPDETLAVIGSQWEKEACRPESRNQNRDTRSRGRWQGALPGDSSRGRKWSFPCASQSRADITPGRGPPFSAVQT